MEIRSPHPTRLRRERQRRALKWAIAVVMACLVVTGIVAQYIGLNPLMALYGAGPFSGRVTDDAGRPIPGAFVSFKWCGDAFHGSAGCGVATFTRTDAEGRYRVGWQGLRVATAFGWNLRMHQSIWAPGYITREEGKGLTLIPEVVPDPSTPRMIEEGVDPGGAVGDDDWPALVDLRTLRFQMLYDQLCVQQAVQSHNAFGLLSMRLHSVSLAKLKRTQSKRLDAEQIERFRMMGSPDPTNDRNAALPREAADASCDLAKRQFASLDEPGYDENDLSRIAMEQPAKPTFVLPRPSVGATIAPNPVSGRQPQTQQGGRSAAGGRNPVRSAGKDP